MVAALREYVGYILGRFDFGDCNLIWLHKVLHIPIQSWLDVLHAVGLDEPGSNLGYGHYVVFKIYRCLLFDLRPILLKNHSYHSTQRDYLAHRFMECKQLRVVCWSWRDGLFHKFPQDGRFVLQEYVTNLRLSINLVCVKTWVGVPYYLGMCSFHEVRAKVFCASKVLKKMFDCGPIEMSWLPSMLC